jgi:hypothetical protein
MDINFTDTKKLDNSVAPRTKSSRGSKVFLILSLLLIIALAAAGYFFWQWNLLRNNPAISGVEESKDLVEEIGRMILLPEGELPTVATVTDPAALSNQPFFANAKVGYKVLVYSLAKKAILYDPVNNKIIEVGPISTADAPVDSGATNTEPKEEPKKN